MIDIQQDDLPSDYLRYKGFLLEMQETMMATQQSFLMCGLADGQLAFTQEVETDFCELRAIMEDIKKSIDTKLKEAEVSKARLLIAEYES